MVSDEAKLLGRSLSRWDAFLDQFRLKSSCSLRMSDLWASFRASPLETPLIPFVEPLKLVVLLVFHVKEATETCNWCLSGVELRR